VSNTFLMKNDRNSMGINLDLKFLPSSHLLTL